MNSYRFDHSIYPIEQFGDGTFKLTALTWQTALDVPQTSLRASDSGQWIRAGDMAEDVLYGMVGASIHERLERCGVDPQGDLVREGRWVHRFLPAGNLSWSDLSEIDRHIVNMRFGDSPLPYTTIFKLLML